MVAEEDYFINLKKKSAEPKYEAVKKFITLVLVLFLTFSLNGFTQERSSKKPQPAKTEKTKKVSTKKGSRPKKPVKKKIHRRGTMRHGHKVKL